MKGDEIMKISILKAIVVCTLALSLIATSASAVTAWNNEVSVCRHDGPHDGMIGQ